MLGWSPSVHVHLADRTERRLMHSKILHAIHCPCSLREIRLSLPFIVPSSLRPSLCQQRGRKEGAKTYRRKASRCTPARIEGGAETQPDGLNYPPAPQRLPTPVAGTPFCCRHMPFPAWTQALLQTSLPIHSQSPGGWCSWEPGERSGEEAQGCGRRRKRGRATCQVFQRK